MSKWKVSSNYCVGAKSYMVYRLIDESKVDHSGNREYYPNFYTTTCTDAECLAEKLNLREEKKSFVENELTCLVKKIEPDVQSLSYYITEDFEEYIDINCKFNFKDKAVNHSIKVCVTADSFSALTRDVLNVI